jgi:subtilisin family serine protease
MSFILGNLSSRDALWPAAQSLAHAAKLSYSDFKIIESVAMEDGGFTTVREIPGDTPGFLAEAAGTAVVCLRGPISTFDWLRDLDADSTSWNNHGEAHRVVLEKSRAIEAQVEAFLSNEAIRNIWFTGHNWGGAVAAQLAVNLNMPDKLAGIHTFGQPQFADHAASSSLQERYKDNYARFVITGDIATVVPPGYQHFGKLILFDENGNLAETSSDPHADAKPRAIDEEKFASLKQELQQLQTAAETEGNYLRDSRLPAPSGTTPGKDFLDISARGLIPGLSDNAIDRYISLIQRQISKASLESALTGAVARTRHDDAGSGEVFDDVELVSRGDSNHDMPVLIRLRSANWTPPPSLKINSRIGTIVSAVGSAQALAPLENDGNVANVEISRDAGIEELNRAILFVGGNQIHSPALDRTPPFPGERGDKAVIGVIDSGVDILHQSFLGDDAKPRILAIWDQRDASTDKTPAKRDPSFTQDYGRLYLHPELIAFADNEFPETDVPSRLRDPSETHGHGTHVASIAAGRAVENGPAAGMAPEARLVVVIPNMLTTPGNPPSLGYSVSHVDALSFLRRVAEGRTAVLGEALPMAVNVSLGMNAGAHDGTSALETAFDQVSNGGSDPGFVIIKSAGNEFGYDGHVRIRLLEGAVQHIRWTTDSSFRKRDYMEVWFESLDEVDFTLVDPTGRRSATVSRLHPSYNQAIGGVSWDLRYERLHTDNGASLLQISIIATGNSIPAGTWSLECLGRRVRSEGGFMDAWTERDRYRAVKFKNSDNLMTLSIPGTAHSVICVGACESGEPLALGPFSSAGRTRDGRPKPDICAPGVDITAAKSMTRNGKVVESGTSMAAPMVTGAVALALSHRHKTGHQLNAKQIRAVILRTAANFSRVHNEGFGFGRLNASAFFDDLDQIDDGNLFI